MIDEWYLEDLSKNIRKFLRQNGMDNIGSFPPMVI